MTINLNDKIKVKLNDKGKDIFYHQFDEIISLYPQCHIDPRMPNVDENGYTTFQIWEFMKLYGGHIGMAKPSVLENINVIYPSAEPERNNKEFIKLTVRNSNGRPYYSIIYLEIDKNGVGHDFEGYSSYDLDVISAYLKNDFGIAQPERKKGKWERHNTYHGDDTSGFVDPDWRCSECGKQATVNEWMLYVLSNFCPNCGADMRGDDNE